MDVVVVGSCMTDLVTYTPRMPKLGETLHGDKFSIGFGGKGANQCVVASRLGAKVAMVAMLGDDTFGQNYLQNFKENGVNVDHVKVTADAATGAAQITVDKDGHNAIVIVAGANLLLNERHIQESESLIKSAKIVVCQLEISQKTTLAALKLARNVGTMSILNPAPATADLDPEMYKLCDIFCPNETETELLIGRPVSSVDDAKQAVDILLSKGCKQVIITLGEKGCVYGAQNEECVHVPAKKVTPVDSTGAGDAFVGALAYYLTDESVKHLSFATKLQRSCDIASVSVQEKGTQTSYPWRKNLDAKLFT